MPATHFRSLLVAVATITGALALAAPVAAQPWPQRPLRIVVPYPAGGGIDILSRLVAQRLAQAAKQPVTVENKPGAGTLVAAETVARAAPDGTTLMITTDATITINPHLYARLPYDPVKDFVPVTQLVFLNQILLGNAGLAPATLKDLIAHAKAQPGRLNYASYGVGSQPHLAMEILKSQAGIDIVHVPYKGIPQAVPAAIAGEVQLTFSGAASSMAHLRAGKLKAYAIGGAKRLGVVPDIPTFAEQGFPDVPANAWFGLFVPAGTPRDLVAALHGEVTRLLREPDFLQKEVVAKGYELVASSPEEFAAFLPADSRRNAQAVKVSGARAD
jgi:tripartite-type tricarboxylate transporter receptor subunit TctC